MHESKYACSDVSQLTLATCQIEAWSIRCQQQQMPALRTKASSRQGQRRFSRVHSARCRKIYSCPKKLSSLLPPSSASSGWMWTGEWLTTPTKIGLVTKASGSDHGENGAWLSGWTWKKRETLETENVWHPSLFKLSFVGQGTDYFGRGFMACACFYINAIQTGKTIRLFPVLL